MTLIFRLKFVIHFGFCVNTRYIILYNRIILAHQSRRLRISLLDGTRAGVCPCVHASTLSNINISETSWPIVIKFYLEHYWGRGLAAFGFGPDRIRTLISMATDSSHRVIKGKTL